MREMVAGCCRLVAVNSWVTLLVHLANQANIGCFSFYIFCSFLRFLIRFDICSIRSDICFARCPRTQGNT
jgi:hypothetical protein